MNFVFFCVYFMQSIALDKTLNLELFFFHSSEFCIGKNAEQLLGN